MDEKFLLDVSGEKKEEIKSLRDAGEELKESYGESNHECQNEKCGHNFICEECQRIIKALAEWEKVTKGEKNEG